VKTSDPANTRDEYKVNTNKYNLVCVLKSPTMVVQHVINTTKYFDENARLYSLLTDYCRCWKPGGGPRPKGPGPPGPGGNPNIPIGPGPIGP